MYTCIYNKPTGSRGTCSKHTLKYVQQADYMYVYMYNKPTGSRGTCAKHTEVSIAVPVYSNNVSTGYLALAMVR